MILTFQTFVNDMRIKQQPVNLKLRDNVRFGYDILLTNFKASIVKSWLEQHIALFQVLNNE